MRNRIFSSVVIGTPRTHSLLNLEYGQVLFQTQTAVFLLLMAVVYAFPPYPGLAHRIVLVRYNLKHLYSFLPLQSRPMQPLKPRTTNIDDLL